VSTATGPYEAFGAQATTPVQTRRGRIGADACGIGEGLFAPGIPLTRLALVAATCALVALACTGRGPIDDPWALTEGACDRHDHCADGEACIERACVRGALDDPLTMAEVDASVWFADPSGACRWDSECGPWACEDGACVAPETTARYGDLRRSDLRWWDGSCQSADDCGGLLCADDFCVAVGHVAPTAEPGVDPPPTGGLTCLSDEMCPDGADCVSPGWCVDGVVDDPMTWHDIDAASFAAHDDGSCNYDADCGPWVCHEGWCMRPEYAGHDVPTRGDFRWFDSSCSGDADCGEWLCVREFCTAPDRVTTYAGDETNRSDAARLWRDGLVQPPLHDPRDPDPPLDPSPSGRQAMGVVAGTFDAELADEDGELMLLGTLGDSSFEGSPYGADVFDGELDEDAALLFDAMSGYEFDAEAYAAGSAVDDVYDTFGGGVVGGLDEDGGQGGGGGVLDTGGLGLSGSGTGGGYGTGGATPGTPCLEHLDCDPGVACVNPGVCDDGRLDEPMRVGDIDATNWFDHADGSCTDHPECGPWACNDGRCAPWADLDVVMPVRRSFRFYDLSCSGDADCGDWACESGFCNPR